ncbi:MAG: response regulator transcription factor, partial [Solirubrobacterales bacterium]
VGRLEATRGRLDEAIVLLERSIHEYTRFPSPIWRGRAMLELAAVLRKTGRNEARQGSLVAEARALGVRHGAGLLLGDDEEDAAVGVASRPDPGERLEALNLTDRQRDIIALVARGMTNAEIAEDLRISPRTVKRHVEDAFARAGVRGRKGLMALLYE